MKTHRIAQWLFTLFLISTGSQAFAQIQTFEWQNVQRQYLVRTPAQSDGDIPVLYFLHGLGDNITRLDNEFHFQQIADQLGWAIVVPQALNDGYGTMWNAGLTASTTNDSGFLMALLDSLAEPCQINLDSVFFTGFSMGGFMSHRMAIEHGDRIAACAPVSGLITSPMANHTAVAPVRMLHIHGTADPVVGYDGGSQYFGYQLGLSVDNIINYWKNANDCTGEPQIDTLPDLQNDGLRFVRYTYDCGTDLQHIKVIGGNHTWYHSEDQYDIGYLTEIVKFFKGTNNTTEVLYHAEADPLKVYPNPTSGLINIDIDETTNIELMDLQGRIIAKHLVKQGVNIINLEKLPEGLYFIKTGNGAFKKILKTK
ncbi:MAG: T9SS type A sorting domain-containing protein [Bacteroidales bacterium]|nr:T9SS type A sorting domain-containing protein [Bacteroidales bacterium]